ncbi:carboxypeptidase-like regulatory domain-containing protein [Hanstruepera marina]|uniref:carboxypeptidase-like regulatory domain-containing protein n=1 Tax=Hanstruepera marina TaxID=2873265 RepID=UPI001CA76D31|nr:carboxypeptidase-like regulatory domain-containing protein [Hanstruepera marina]
MNRTALFIVFLIISPIVYGQQIIMTGVLKDLETGKPIEFVNIGVYNKNVGTISNFNGEFRLVLPISFINDSLTISHVGYETIKIKIQKSKNIEISLTPKLNDLDEILITTKKKKTRKIGVKSYNRLLWLSSISRENDILENAQRIKIPNNSSVKVKNVNFLLRKGFESDSCFIRINFYKNSNNYPGEKIVFSNIVENKYFKPGWITFNLSDYDIYLDEDFFVGIEFIPNFKSDRKIFLGAILTKGKGFIRSSSQGKWEKTQGASSIYVEVEY